MVNGVFLGLVIVICMMRDIQYDTIFLFGHVFKDFSAFIILRNYQ